MHGAQKVLSNNGFRMANCFCCLTKCHGVPWSLPSRITTKVLKNCKTFSSRPRPNVQDQDQDFHFCPPDQDQAGLEDNITGNRCKEARCISYSIASHISAVLLSELSNHTHLAALYPRTPRRYRNRFYYYYSQLSETVRILRRDFAHFVKFFST